MLLFHWLRPIPLLAALALTGCGGTASDVETVVLWAMGREGEVVQQLLPEFESAHPGIKVKVQQIPWSAAHEKLLTAYAGGNMPDVVQLGGTWLAEFVAIGALQPLDRRLAASSLPPDDYYPAALDANRLDGELYGLPWYVDTRVLFYRTDLLEKAGVGQVPATWQQWLKALGKVQAGKRAEYALLLPMNEWELPTALAWQENAELLRDGGRYGNFRSDAFRRAFGFYVSLYQRHLAPAQSSSQISNTHQEFARGYFAAFVSGPWNVGELRRRLPPAMQSRWATAPLPAREGDEPGLSLAGGASLAISRQAQHPDAAWAVLEYLSQPQQQIRFYQLTGDLPPRRDSWADPALATDPTLEAFRRQLPHMRAAPQVPEWERIASKIAYYAEQAARGKMTQDEALAALDQETDAILEKRRWLLRQRER
ncbi:sugar ABC transporter substrate-binding protein [Methylogaea oryzae]|uniref:Sugar ABC transporter substrate-binding protein n=2 Tax=Methylogaea oryzae TaxID=1295382 RepID=A0A8D5ALD9_9GAMM|nr:sugar ABC transporter substrate-binding protein [Methylogaea oryzae]BBL72001.1 sugar ABC transporter substrate-binding protein [Methylogaea oryzae]